MDLDLVLVLGCVISVLAILAIISAFSDNRIPRYPALIILIGVVMVGYAVNGKTGAYNFYTLPDVFLRVVGRYIV